MQKRLLLAIVSLVLIGGRVAGGIYATSGGSRITAEAYEKIRDGMTRQQVEEIFGGPARDEFPQMPFEVEIDMGPFS